MEQRPLITCRQLIDFIAGHVEGELDETARNDFDRHLVRCPSCVAYLRTYSETIRLVRSSATDKPTPDLPEELVEIVLRTTADRDQ
jgi:anti-sigma factor RsiW